MTDITVRYMPEAHRITMETRRMGELSQRVLAGVARAAVAAADGVRAHDTRAGHGTREHFDNETSARQDDRAAFGRGELGALSL